jgi:hypothetical protein
MVFILTSGSKSAYTITSPQFPSVAQMLTPPFATQKQNMQFSAQKLQVQHVPQIPYLQKHKTTKGKFQYADKSN